MKVAIHPGTAVWARTGLEVRHECTTGSLCNRQILLLALTLPPLACMLATACFIPSRITTSLPSQHVICKAGSGGSHLLDSLPLEALFDAPEGRHVGARARPSHTTSAPAPTLMVLGRVGALSSSHLSSAKAKDWLRPSASVTLTLVMSLVAGRVGCTRPCVFWRRCGILVKRALEQGQWQRLGVAGGMLD